MGTRCFFKDSKPMTCHMAIGALRAADVTFKTFTGSGKQLFGLSSCAFFSGDSEAARCTHITSYHIYIYPYLDISVSDVHLQMIL